MTHEVAYEFSCSPSPRACKSRIIDFDVETLIFSKFYLKLIDLAFSTGLPLLKLQDPLFPQVYASRLSRNHPIERISGSSYSHTMLKVPEHQVAGHMAVGGKLGPLIDDTGRFYKPLQGDERGEKELKFYKSFSANNKVPDHIRRFFPVFYGTQLVEASDGSGLRPHLVLQDVVSGYSIPSVMDIKIGSRTWYLNAPYDYIQKCVKKDIKTTTVVLGFRISGLRIYNNKESGFWKPDRKLVLSFSVDDVRLALRKFVSSNSPADCNIKPDCAFASSVYGGSNGILAQLLELKVWFEDQRLYHFNSCSILMVYENESILDGGDAHAAIKLVDFAHVLEGNGVIDHNFLGGLYSLIKLIQDVLERPDEYLEKEIPCLENGH